MNNSRTGVTTLALPGFEHISRGWDATHDRSSAKILPGEYYVTKERELIHTVLGSCVSACIRDIDTGIGGMNHFMLPEGAPSEKLWNLETRFGVAAMESLINDIVKAGGNRNRLELKLFGGGEVMNMKTSSVGKRNVEFALDFAKVEGLEVASQDLGGEYPRKVLFFPNDGKVMVRRLRPVQTAAVVAQEKQYETRLCNKTQKPGDIELFG